jgi:Tol biopolymer transport system component
MLSPDGTRVIFTADRTVDGMLDLYSVPTRGGTPIQLNDNPINGGSIESFDISPDSQYVVFVGDLESDGKTELFSVPINGGTQVKQSSPGFFGQCQII